MWWKSSAQAAVQPQPDGGGSTTFFDQLGLHRLIALVPDAGELRAFETELAMLGYERGEFLGRIQELLAPLLSEEDR